MNRLPVALLILSLFMLVTANVSGNSHASGAAEYRAGVEAFRNADYPRALEHFQSAREQGRTGPNLMYNLAVTHYRLEQYTQAERIFRELAGVPDWQDVARYNLGLVALRQGDRREAERWFREVRRTSDDQRLVFLAGQGLRELGYSVDVASASSPDKNWLALLSLSGGYNDNPLAFPELQAAGTSNDDDGFVEFLGYGQAYVSGGSGNGVRLHGFAFTKQYLDLNIVDVTTVNAGATADRTFNDWKVSFGAAAGNSQVDGNTLTTRYQGEFGLERSVGNNLYSLNYQPVYHDAGRAYAYLDGWQHKLDLRWRHRVDRGRWTLRYRLDYNDREDLTTPGSFLSFSALRNSILLERDWHATPEWSFTLGGEYMNSQYEGENRLEDIDGEFKVQGREADRLEAWLRAEYELSEHWRVRAEYSYTDNNENYELYQYQSNEIKLGLEFTY